MKYPIVEVNTSDNIPLQGFLAESPNKETIIINIHGTGSSFYSEGFEKYFVEILPNKNISVLFTNNRGSYIMAWQNKGGAAMEKFEDCLTDIDTWVEFARNKGYKNIVLQGHSFGTNKVIYYMNNGAFKDLISAIILLGFSDSYGVQINFLSKTNLKNEDLLKEATMLIVEGKEKQFLTTFWNSRAGVMPQSALTYLNMFSENSELSKNFPLRKRNKLQRFSKIKVPILAIIGSKDNWTILPPSEAIKLLEKENKLVEAHIIPNTKHSFDGKEKEVVALVYSFISRAGLTNK